MKNDKLPKFLLCKKYDVNTALLNRATGAFDARTSVCSECRCKIFITKASLDLLASDKDVKPICGKCAENFNRIHGKPQFAMTAGHIKEIESALAKIKAGNN